MKAGLVDFIILVPFLGRRSSTPSRVEQITEHDIEAARSQQAAFDEYVRSTAGSGGGSAADELAKLAELKQSGVLSEASSRQQKASSSAYGRRVGRLGDRAPRPRTIPVVGHGRRRRR